MQKCEDLRNSSRHTHPNTQVLRVNRHPKEREREREREIIRTISVAHTQTVVA